MTKAELVAAIAAKAEVSKKDVDAMLKALTEVVTDDLKAGGKVALPGLGTFETAEVGEKTAKILANEFDTIDNLINADIERLSSIDNIGEVMANAIYNFFKEEKNIELINKLKELGLNTTNLNKKVVDSSSFFANKVILPLVPQLLSHHELS